MPRMQADVRNEIEKRSARGFLSGMYPIEVPDMQDSPYEAGKVFEVQVGSWETRQGFARMFSVRRNGCIMSICR